MVERAVINLISRVDDKRLSAKSPADGDTGSNPTRLSQHIRVWLVGRVDDCSCLENNRTERYRGFESYTSRPKTRCVRAWSLERPSIPCPTSGLLYRKENN